ncbi:hypothetical protein PSEUBRA_002402 [Kalmanozyma brasiliensis GHG001]|uniref:Uncharacterized protein n=1 Tax=Kalmanozyma brasiliensis (strain GHG001) TaxID=1365824 RepID=V5EX59_KALBG|nr:uncharacterized protein PSEUBRA_002402 [Kalmanozyma brasiliensis GHG001]EST08008.1 hypothetical protein PSEUBRA_002402 [Kalmanozyma brasiliensis GHG001]
MPGITKRPDFSSPEFRGSPQYAGASAMFPAAAKEVSVPGVTRRPDFSDPQYRGSPQYTGASAMFPAAVKEVSTPGVTKRPDFSDPQFRGSPQYTGASALTHMKQHSPTKKTVRLAENPHVSAFLSPKSRMFTGGHGYPGVPARGQSTGAYSTSSAPAAEFSVSGKQLTPDEVAQKIASMLKPGPPFFSRVSNADLIDFISDSSIMNCDALRKQAEVLEAKKIANRATAAFVPSGTVVRRRAEEERWTGVGTVWSSLDGLPAGASFGRIPGQETMSAQASGTEDDGLWNAITLSCDIDCTNVTLAKSVVVPTQVLQHNNFFNGNSQSLFDEIGAGAKYKFDELLGKKSSSHKQSASSSTTGSKITPNYLSLSAYTDPNAAFNATSFELKWPSWMPWGKKTAPVEGAPATTPAAGGQKRVWVPSSTKVSIHASWWGYNLYLPQPVLDKLDGDVDEAEKVANLINKCLTYILNNVPAGLPASFAAVVVILKAIAPTTGYISTFIGWSWDTIKSFNKGQGVVLSATWILPVALIPRAWDAPASPNGSAPATPSTPAVPLPATPAAPADSTTPAAGGGSTTTPATGGTGSTTTPATGGTGSTTTPAPTTGNGSTTTPTTTTPTAVSGTGMPMTAQDVVNDPENNPLPDPNIPPVAAPGATLPPANPSTVNLDLSAPPTNDTANASYPGDARGRGGDQSTAAPMGNTPIPAGQVPIDAES